MRLILLTALLSISCASSGSLRIPVRALPQLTSSEDHRDCYIRSSADHLLIVRCLEQPGGAQIESRFCVVGANEKLIQATVEQDWLTKCVVK